jgi:hypothetical protein
MAERFGSEIIFSRARGMLRQCLESHPNCGQSQVPTLPRRVIAVGKRGTKRVRLYIPNPEERAEYACLSYCWGGSQELVAMTTNEEQLKRAIKLERLGQTIQDAITLTRKLGIRYLWVDALCILQDDTEGKATDIQNMASIYGDATVTIAAAIAGTSTEGFMHRILDGEVGDASDRPLKPYREWYQYRWKTQEPIRQAISLPSGKFLGSIELYHADEKNFRNLQTGYNPSIRHPLDYRAWTLQETLLSPRMIYISSYDVLWFCRRQYGYSIYQGILRSFLNADFSHGAFRQIIEHGIRSQQEDPGSASITSQGHNGTEFHQQWDKVLGDYTTRKLSEPEDRLNALKGVISAIEKVRKEKCYFGHWPSCLVLSLAWYIYPDHHDGGTGSSGMPSWSWAGWNYPISHWGYGNYTFVPHSAVLDMDDSGILQLEVRTLPDTTRLQWSEHRFDTPRTAQPWGRLVKILLGLVRDEEESALRGTLLFLIVEKDESRAGPGEPPRTFYRRVGVGSGRIRIKHYKGVEERSQVIYIR